MKELTGLGAVEMIALLRKGEVSPLEAVDAAAARIEEVDGEVNAIPVHMFDEARERARAFRPDPSRADGPGWLAGLPVAIKDYNDVAGQVTSYGSPIYADNVVATSDVTVRTIEAAGGIVIGKSNVPEFAGSNTFNRVYGATRNPWDLERTAGGSSGGAAAALAAGEVWLANGSDLGGSLRIPASYCGITGLRPSVGRVARGASCPSFDPLWVEGPMARNVADLAMFLDAQSCHTIEDPLVLPRPDTPFAQAATAPKAPVRVGFSTDLGQGRSVDPEVAAICRDAAMAFTAAGVAVEDSCPDMSGSIEAFQTLRALMFATNRAEVLDTHREEVAPEIVWNLEKGLELTAAQIIDADRTRSRIYHSVVDFFGSHDLLLCPTVALPPFAVTERYPTKIGDDVLTNYIDWMFLTFCLTLTGCPVLSIPCGFTKSGLPVGLQLMGRPRGEYDLIAAAQILETILAVPKQARPKAGAIA